MSMTNVEGRSFVTVAWAIQGSRSSRASADPASRVNTFVPGVIPAIRRTSDRVTCDVPLTSILWAAKYGLLVSVTAAAPSNTVAMNAIAAIFRTRSCGPGTRRSDGPSTAAGS